jgi:striatin 1/3/4
MRFLQTEWHRHERDRNAWEIERAEMKSRIGRLEGELRTSKRLHESLGKHVRLMEGALKKEREKVKKLANNEKLEDIQDPKDLARESISFLKGMADLLIAIMKWTTPTDFDLTRTTIFTVCGHECQSGRP